MTTSIATTTTSTELPHSPPTTVNLLSSPPPTVATGTSLQIQCFPATSAIYTAPPFPPGHHYRPYTYYHPSLPVDTLQTSPKCQFPPPLAGSLQQIRDRFFPTPSIDKSSHDSSYLTNKVAATLLKLHEPVIHQPSTAPGGSFKLLTPPPVVTNSSSIYEIANSTSAAIAYPSQLMLQSPYHHTFSQTATPAVAPANCWHPNTWPYIPLGSHDFKSNSCHVCGKTYARLSTLRSHLKSHSGEKPYQCSICQKSFTQAANLTAHLRTHSGEKPFKCPVCHRGFSQSSSVTTHMRTHSGDRPYKCNVCNKGFADSSTLTKHYRTHTGEKPYQCKICEAKFSQSGNLNRHMRTHRHHFLDTLR